MYLLSLADARRALGTQSVDAESTDKLLDSIVRVSAWLEVHCRRTFIPVRETRAFKALATAQGGGVKGSTLWLFDDLISVETITNGTGATLSSGSYELLPVTGAPYQQIFAKPSAGFDWLATNGDTPIESAIRILGEWGWACEWEETGRTLTTGIDASTTTLPVAAWTTDRSMILRIGNEIMYVKADATNSTSVTVKRGQRGTVAASANSGAAIKQFVAHPLAQSVVRRMLQVAEQRDKSPLFGAVVVGDMAQTVEVDRLPQDVANDIKRLRRVSGFAGV